MLLGLMTEFYIWADYQSLHINCGGKNVTVSNSHGSLLYQGDIDGDYGASLNYIARNWGFSSTGDFMDDDEKNTKSKYLVSSKFMANFGDSTASTFYTTARGSPLSLTYYGFCLKNGNYTVQLHFAEIVFNDEIAYNMLGRRIFDIYIQVNNNFRLLFLSFNCFSKYIICFRGRKC